MTEERWDKSEMPLGWKLPDKRYYMVLNDGVTYTELRLCRIVEVDWDVAENPDTDFDDLFMTAGYGAARDNSGKAVAEVIHTF